MPPYKRDITMWTKTEDGSIVDAENRVIFFSTERFVNDICLGDSCFICGAHPDEKDFNNEHILPEWLLRRYDLFGKKITLPNGSTVRYDTYTVSCCSECNSLMGDQIEKPVSEVVRRGANAINDYIVQGNFLKVFVWMGLIFLKTHLKDRAFRYHLDMREGEEKVSDLYEWEDLHHIHTLVRCFYTDCFIEEEAFGSFLTIPVRQEISQERFDFVDLYQAQTMLLRLDDTAMLTVFNDSGGAMAYFSQHLEKIDGPVSELQLREIMVELAYLNSHLKERPTFRSELNTVDEVSRILAHRPDLKLKKLDRSIRGKLLYRALEFALPNIKIIGKTDEQVLAAIKAGTLTFLFNDDGVFIK